MVMEIDLDYVKSMKGGGVQVAGILAQVPEAEAEVEEQNRCAGFGIHERNIDLVRGGTQVIQM